MRQVAALFVRADSVYKSMPGVDCYDIERDARAKVTQFDEGAVQLEITGVVGTAEWTDLAALIGEAMRQMELEG